MATLFFAPEPGTIPAAVFAAPCRFVALSLDRGYRSALEARLPARAVLETKPLFRRLVAEQAQDISRTLAQVVARLPVRTANAVIAGELSLYKLRSARLFLLHSLLLELLKNGGDDIHFFTNEDALFQQMLETAPVGLRCEACASPAVDLPSGPEANEGARAYARVLKRAAQPLPELSGAGPLTLLHLHADLRLAQQSDPLGFYYQRLPQHLAARGGTVLTLAVVMDHTPDNATRRTLAGKIGPSLFLEDVLGHEGAGAALRNDLRHLGGVRGRAMLRGADVTRLLHGPEFRRGSWASLHCEAHYQAIANLARQGVRLERFVYLMENQPWERTAILALRRFHPACRIIGFQHAQIPVHSGYLPVGEAFRYLPAPDRIVCSGRNTFEAMAPVWGGVTEVLPGPALRHEYMHAPRPRLGGASAGLPLGVGGSCYLEHTEELVDALRQARPSLPGVDFLLKLHPDHWAEVGAALLGTLNAGMEQTPCASVHAGGAGDFLSASRGVVSPGSSLLLEARLQGLPSLLYAPYHDFELSYHGVDTPRADTPEELGAALRAMLCGGSAPASWPAPASPAEREHFFGRITEPGMELFA